MMRAALLLAALGQYGSPIPEQMLPTLPTPPPSAMTLAASDLFAEKETPPAPATWEHKEALLALGVRLEVMDRRETYFFQIPELYEKDVDIIRNRILDLKGAPTLSDIQRYDHLSKDEINATIRLNRAYKLHLETRMAWEPDRQMILSEAIRETELCYRAWSNLAEMRTPFYFVSVRRRAALVFRDIVGEEAFQGGELPPSVPHWRFNQR
jgi:hypothetical protein